LDEKSASKTGLKTILTGIKKC